MKVSPGVLMGSLVAALLVGCGGGGDQPAAESSVNGASGSASAPPAAIDHPAPVANAGVDRTVWQRGLVVLDGRAEAFSGADLQYQWRLITKPVDSVAVLANAEEKSPSFSADVPGRYQFALAVNDGRKTSVMEDLVDVTYEPTAAPPVSASVRQYAWEDLQRQIDRGGSGNVIHLDPNIIYVLDSTLSLRDFSSIRIDGHGAVIMRADSADVATRLAQHYLGGTTIQVTAVPGNYRVGETLVLVSGQTDNELTRTPRQIVAIDGTRITMDQPFNEHFGRGTTVLKSYYLIEGLPSNIKGGANPGTIIENVIIDGNARGNTVNYSWRINGTLGLHGGTSSEIRHSRFVDIPNENIIGHGVDVHHNTFDGLNGSAFHTSLHDTSKDVNARSRFRNNAVFDPNRAPRRANNHSEGAVTFSWGGGNLDVTDNLFVSMSGLYGVLGHFNGEAQHADENLVVMRNQAYNFESIIDLYSPTLTPVKNVLITGNVFDVDRVMYHWNIQDNDSIRLGCNVDSRGVPIVVEPIHSACE